MKIGGIDMLVKIKKLSALFIVPGALILSLGTVGCDLDAENPNSLVEDDLTNPAVAGASLTVPSIRSALERDMYCALFRWPAMRRRGSDPGTHGAHWTKVRYQTSTTSLWTLSGRTLPRDGGCATEP